MPQAPVSPFLSSNGSGIASGTTRRTTPNGNAIGSTLHSPTVLLLPLLLLPLLLLPLLPLLLPGSE
jgi:hypothetical protein